MEWDGITIDTSLTELTDWKCEDCKHWKEDCPCDMQDKIFPDTLCDYERTIFRKDFGCKFFKLND